MHQSFGISMNCCNFAPQKQLVGLSLASSGCRRKVRATQSIPLLNGKQSVRVE